MGFQGVASSGSRYNHHDAAKVTQYTIFRDNFKLTTWLALGAFLQVILSYLLPAAYAAVPAVLLLACRFLKSYLMHKRLVQNKQMDGVLLGKYSVQIPRVDGMLSEKPSSKQVAVLILAARSNHALGLFGPGYKDVSDYINGMVADLWENSDKHGFLSQTTWLAANERHTNNQAMVLCYFRSMEDLHRYAHGPLHQKAWRWWNSITATHPHLSIMHEMYEAPKNHWENIFINNHITGIARIQPRGEDSGAHLVDASRGSFRTQMGRLGRGDGGENRKYGLGSYEH